MEAINYPFFLLRLFAKESIRKPPFQETKSSDLEVFIMFELNEYYTRKEEVVAALAE